MDSDRLENRTLDLEPPARQSPAASRLPRLSGVPPASRRKGKSSGAVFAGQGAATPQELHERTAKFLDANRVFSRSEFAEALGLHRDPEAVGSLLRRHVEAGRVKRAAKEVFIVASDASPARFVVQDCIIASKLRPDGVLGYHTALELFGISYTALYNTVHLISRGQPDTVDLPFRTCRIVRPHRSLIRAGQTDFLTIEVEREGVPMKVTAFERTLVDVLHRADRAGGRDEVIECLNVAPYLVDDFDCRKVADYVELLGIRSIAGVVGWWLERWHSELNVSHLTLERLQDMLPGWKPYGLLSRPGYAVFDRYWRVYLPPDALDTSFEGTDPDLEF